ncbi:MAG TPA: prolipoprotein diacylglyceryl transferase [Bacteroidota bacterium]|nr:prolipoprotein diacylglyceryl transferase [Bacteroidota bacterium]
MYPRLFTIGPFTVYSYGLMLGIGFIIASILLTKELKRKGLDPNMGSTITLLAVIFGITGSKLLYLFEHWDFFIAHPIDMAFSPGGLTWYGGFFLATFSIMLYTRKKRISFLKICDVAAPGLILAYGIARIGCHLAGDGDYGLPTDLPWAAVYSNGTYPPSAAFRDFPEIVKQYGINGIVPDTIPVHPAPVYEFLINTGLFFVLWGLRKKLTSDGKLFMIYLMLSGASRLVIEFIRLNPRIFFGLTEAQLFSSVIVIVGVIGYQILSRAKPRANISTA